jgi:hypothetical protein
MDAVRLQDNSRRPMNPATITSRYFLLVMACLILVFPAVLRAQDFTYTTNDGTITITKYIGSDEAVTIPSNINGLQVTSVGNYAFYNSTNLTNVSIPNSVTNIGEGAFYACTSLTSVTIPNGVTSIGFAAFNFCRSLTAITVDTLDPAYSSVDGVLFNKTQTTLIRFPAGKTGNYTVPDTVASIGATAFAYCINLPSVMIPDSVTSIGDSAFDSCTGLSSLKIPNSVINIRGGTFYSCTGLTNVTIPDSVTIIGEQAFAYCISLASVAIPDSVSFIGEQSFAYCTSLASVTIPDSVSFIGEQAFAYCTNLSGVTIGKGVFSFGGEVFVNCPSLTGVYCRGNAPRVDANVFYGDNKATAYYLPGTADWGSTFGGRPTAQWVLQYPIILTTSPDFGIRANAFGLRISWATNISVVVEASTSLTNPGWVPVATNTLIGGSSYFSDPDWANYSSRFYRIRSP